MHCNQNKIQCNANQNKIQSITLTAKVSKSMQHDTLVVCKCSPNVIFRHFLLSEKYVLPLTGNLIKIKCHVFEF